METGHKQAVHICKADQINSNGRNRKQDIETVNESTQWMHQQSYAAEFIYPR